MSIVIAVLAGAGTAAVLYWAGAVTAFVALYGIPLGASPGPPGPGYFALNLGAAGLAALIGGACTARLSRTRVGVATLAVVLAAVSLWGFSGPASQWPAWYPPVLALVGVAGALAGGLLRLGRSEVPG